MRPSLVVALALAILTVGCNEACWDGNGNGEECGPTHEWYGVAFDVPAVGASGDRFVAIVDHDDYDADIHESSFVELTREGTVVSTTPKDVSFGVFPRIAGDGAGALVAIDTGTYSELEIDAWWLRDGHQVAEAALEDPVDVVASRDGTFWIATATTPRRITPYDSGGVMGVLPVLADDPAAPWTASQGSLAIDPLGEDIAAAWVVEDADQYRVIVDRISGGTGSTVEVARLGAPGVADAWISSVALRDGTIAVLYGLVDDTSVTIALVDATGTVTTHPFAMPPTCSDHNYYYTFARLVGTMTGFAVACGELWRDRFVAVATAGGVVHGGQATLPRVLLETGPQGAVMAYADSHLSMLWQTLDAEPGPLVRVYAGSAGTSTGCTTTPPSSGGLVLAMLLLAKRRRRSAHAHASPGTMPTCATSASSTAHRRRRTR